MGVLSSMAKAGRSLAKSKSGLASKAGKTLSKVKSWEPVKAARTATAKRLREVRKSGLSARNVAGQMGYSGAARAQVAKSVGKGQRVGARIHAIGSSKRVRTAAVAGGVAYVGGRRAGRKAERKRMSR